MDIKIIIAATLTFFSINQSMAADYQDCDNNSLMIYTTCLDINIERSEINIKTAESELYSILSLWNESTTVKNNVKNHYQQEKLAYGLYVKASCELFKAVGGHDTNEELYIRQKNCLFDFNQDRVDDIQNMIKEIKSK